MQRYVLCTRLDKKSLFLDASLAGRDHLFMNCSGGMKE